MTVPQELVYSRLVERNQRHSEYEGLISDYSRTVSTSQTLGRRNRELEQKLRDLTVRP